MTCAGPKWRAAHWITLAEHYHGGRDTPSEAKIVSLRLPTLLRNYRWPSAGDRPCRPRHPRAGEFVTLVGPSGCGKTTLLKALAGFIRPTEGTILCEGRPVRGPGRERGVVFQELAILPWRTVRRNIGHGLEIARVPRAERERTVARLIELTGLTGFEEPLPARAVGRHAPARGRGAHLGGRPRRHPDGRAVRGGRRHDAADAAGGAGAALRGDGQDRVLHHPQRRRGRVPRATGCW